MAVISVVSHCKETAVELETVLRSKGHVVRSLSDSELRQALRPTDGESATESLETGLFVVDIDHDPVGASKQVRAIAEQASTALTPLLVAGSAEAERNIARACALGATGILRKPFRSVETVPDTERALASAYPA